MIVHLNVTHIVRDHLATLHSTEGKRAVWLGNVIMFYVGPLAVAAAFVGIGARVTGTQAGAFINAAAIFAGLLLNLLALLFAKDLRLEKSAYLSSLKADVERETYSNLAYSVLVALVIVTMLVIGTIASPALPAWLQGFGRGGQIAVDVSRLAYAVSIYSMLLHFTLTLLMILRRVHSLLRREYKEKPKAS